MDRAPPRHGERGGASRMRASVSIALQSTSTLAAAAAAESDRTVALSRRRSASTSGHCVADQPNTSSSMVRSACSASRNASSVANRRAIASRRENGSSMASAAARAKPSVSARCRSRGAALDITAVRIVPVYTTWLPGPGGADEESRAPGCGSPLIPVGRMPHGSAAGGDAPAPAPVCPGAEGGGSGAGCETASPVPRSRSISVASNSARPAVEAAPGAAGPPRWRGGSSSRT